jgi:hypothetical protein
MSQTLPEQLQHLDASLLTAVVQQDQRSPSFAIVDWPTEATGDLVTLRQGDNGWTCFTDTPGTPANDPMCLDKTWMVWFQAYLTGSEPEINNVGVAYMLQGGSDASNTDPAATEPAPGEDWVISAPHLMLLAPGGFDPADFSTDHLSNQPYIMFEGTPYEHLMILVADLAMDDQHK